MRKLFTDRISDTCDGRYEHLKGNGWDLPPCQQQQDERMARVKMLAVGTSDRCHTAGVQSQDTGP